MTPHESCCHFLPPSSSEMTTTNDDDDDDDDAQMYFIDVVIITAYDHCVQHYGDFFKDFPVILNTFQDLMKLPTTNDDDAPSPPPNVTHLKQFLFLSMLNQERAMQIEISNHYSNSNGLRLFTTFKERLNDIIEQTLNTPFTTGTTNAYNVQNVIRCFLKKILNDYVCGG